MFIKMFKNYIDTSVKDLKKELQIEIEHDSKNTNTQIQGITKRQVELEVNNAMLSESFRLLSERVDVQNKSIREIIETLADNSTRLNMQGESIVLLNKSILAAMTNLEKDLGKNGVVVLAKVKEHFIEKE